MAALELRNTVPARFTFFLRAAGISRLGRERAAGLFSSWSRDSWLGRWMKQRTWETLNCGRTGIFRTDTSWEFCVLSMPIWKTDRLRGRSTGSP